MANESNADVETIRHDVRRIKDAMGLGERYPSRIRDWLVFGALVTVASALSQYVHVRGYTAFWHPVIWFLFVGGGAVAGFWRGRAESEPVGPRPSIPLVFGAAAIAYVPLLAIVAPFDDGLGYRRGSVVILGIVLVLLGVAYLGVGNALRAYRIRRRDRYTFYLGGLGMLALGGALPNSAFLIEWGYATFGGLYLVYALGSYAVLSRS